MDNIICHNVTTTNFGIVALVQILIVFSSVSLYSRGTAVLSWGVVLCCAVSAGIADHFRKSSVKVYRG
jgi:hypothetical protein